MRGEGGVCFFMGYWRSVFSVSARLENSPNFSNKYIELSDTLFAHSLENRPLSDWQRLDTHLNKVASRAAEFAAAFNSADWAWNAGMLHDIGKAADQFQCYLRRQNNIKDPIYEESISGGVNHSSAGAALAEKLHNDGSRCFGRVLSYLVAGHHAGLTDYETCDSGRGALIMRLEEGQSDLERINQKLESFPATQQPVTKLPPFVKSDNFHFWVRMLFSCLVDADYLDTEEFVEPSRSEERLNQTNVTDLKLLLDNHLRYLAESSAPSTVNEIRKEVLTACRSAAPAEPGLFTLTVPTGGGKTLSATAFALDHAVIHGKSRIIYVIPYTSIIEQTASVLASILGENNVIEHHSNLDPDNEKLRSQLASENWDAPIIVTTNVQFFESLFASKPSRCRKLHNLVNAVVILDEAQLIPPHNLAPCVAAIHELTQNYGATVVLSTATQPALPKLRTPKEIIPADLELYKRLQRVDFVFPATIQTKTSLEQLAEQLTTYSQVLCVVNTRRDCYDLFRLMPEGTIHLSTLMCGEHRSKTIAEIKERLKNGKTVRVISTQLVEAGVDIDFPAVFRALAGLDSIAQAAGRCNREGKLEEKGKVIVFQPPKPAPQGLLHKGETTTKELLTSPFFDAHDPKSYFDYFDLFYGKVSDTGQGILDYLKPSNPNALDVSFRKAGAEFRMIDDYPQQPVIVRYGESDRLLDQLKYAGPSRHLFRKLQRYTVNIPIPIAETMRKDGLLEELWPGIISQACLPLYRDDVGLDIFTVNIPVECYVV